VQPPESLVVQTGCGFLSGGRRGAFLEDRELFWEGHSGADKALSSIDMGGMIGMAQTLAVYHYGHHTLKNRLVQYHEPTREPSEAEAVLEWRLDTPFTSQDKPFFPSNAFMASARLCRRINHHLQLPWL